MPIKHSERTQRCRGSQCEHGENRDFYSYCVPPEHPQASRTHCMDHPGNRVVVLLANDHSTRHHKGFGKPCEETPFDYWWEPDPEAQVPPEPVPSWNGSSQSEDDAQVKEYHNPEPVKTEDSVKDQANDLVQLATLIGKLAGSQVDTETVRKIADEVIGNRLDAIGLPTRVTVVRPDQEYTLPEQVHMSLPMVLKVLAAGDNAWMVGPAGTGKSTIAEQVAEALGYRFGFLGLSPNTAMSEIVGYMDANGHSVKSVFRDFFENGGVFLFDEVDNGHPSTLAKINAALANGHMAFPDGMIVKHPDFQCVAAANTYGTGPDRVYVGRLQIDAATLDRFATVEVPVDETLETSLAQAQGADAHTVSTLINFVRALRKKAQAERMPVVFSPRASIKGAALLAVGCTMAEVIALRVRKGISDTDWQKLTAGLVVPS